MPMSPKELELWARTRAKGRARFIWLNGTLLTGLILAFLLLPWLLPVAALFVGWDRVIHRLPFLLISLPILGYLSGVLTCRRMERRWTETVNEVTEA
jgi:hypothetical protein